MAKNRDIQKDSNPEKPRKRLRTAFWKWSTIMILILLIVGVGLFSYVNIRKNEISKKLLDRVNELVDGEITTEGVTITSLFDYPEIGMKIHGVLIRAPGRELSDSLGHVIRADEVDVKADLSSLLSGDIRINRVEMKGGRLQIVTDTLGEVLISKAFRPVDHGLEKSSTGGEDRSRIDSGTTGFRLEIDTILLNRIEVVILQESGERYVEIGVERLQGNFTLDPQKLGGEVKVEIAPIDLPETERLFMNDLPLFSHLSYKIDLNEDKLEIDADEFRIDQEKYELLYELDYTTDADMQLSMRSFPEGISLESLFVDTDTTDRENDIIIFGRGHLEANFRWKAGMGISFAEAMEAGFLLEGREITIQGADLDDFIDKFNRSQNFNLADVGAVMLAGPAGLAVTKGSDYASLVIGKRGDSTRINHFLTDWSFEEGVLEARDVAFSTQNHRVSTSGNYNVLRDSLDFNIQVLDRRGCELIGQRIYGESAEPQYSKVNVIKTFLGPVSNFFRDLGFGCKTVYEGRVAHPEPEE